VVAQVGHLEEQIGVLGEWLDGLLEPDAALVARLRSIPGVGVENARTWLAEAHPIEQFQGKDDA